MRPRKRSLAKAKPASAEKSTTSSATVELTRMLLPSAFQNGTVVTTVAAFCEEVPAGDEGVRVLHDGSRVLAADDERPPERERRGQQHDDEEDVCRRAGLGAADDLGSHRGPFEAILRVTRKLMTAKTTMMRKSIQATAAARPKFFWVQPSW